MVDLLLAYITAFMAGLFLNCVVNEIRQGKFIWFHAGLALVSMTQTVILLVRQYL